MIAITMTGHLIRPKLSTVYVLVFSSTLHRMLYQSYEIESVFLKTVRDDRLLR